MSTLPLSSLSGKTTRIADAHGPAVSCENPPRLLRPRLVAVDLDGTYLDNNGRISPSNQSVVAELAAEGIAFCIATGRIQARLPQDLERIPALRYFVCANGANVYDRQTGRILASRPIPSARVAAFIEAARPFQIYHEVYIDGEAYTDEDALSYFSPELFPISKRQDLMRSRHIVPDLLLLLAEKSGAGKLFFPVVPDTIAANFAAVIARFPDLVMTRSSARTWELNLKGCSKRNGLEDLARQLGLTLNQVMAFGDAGNDLDMLRGVGYPVAMANSDPDVLKACRYHAGQNHPDGVAQFLRAWVLGGAERRDGTVQN